MSKSRNDFYLEFGVRVRRARIRAGLTQAALAESVGVARTSVTNIEKGRQSVQAHQLAEIADALGVSVATLMPQSEDSRPGADTESVPWLNAKQRRWVDDLLTEDEDSAPPPST